MTDKTLILITGANQGLGYHAAEQLASTGKNHVLLGSRSPEKGAAAVAAIVAVTSHSAANITPIQIDVTSDVSIAAAAKHIKDTYGRLDVLINNAGIAQAQEGAVDGSEPSLRSTYKTHFDTNVFGVAVTTEAFLPLLRASKYHDRRIVCTSSGLGSIGVATDPAGIYNGIKFDFTVYRSTKAALNMLAGMWAIKLAEEGISTVAVDPGYNATNLNAYSGFKDPADGAAIIVRAAVDGTGKDFNHKFISEEGPVPW